MNDESKKESIAIVILFEKENNILESWNRLQTKKLKQNQFRKCRIS